MPVYDFYCADCRTSHEVLRSMADADAPLPCATCGSTQHVSRLISTFAVVNGEPDTVTPAAFRGSGGCCGGACGCAG